MLPRTHPALQMSVSVFLNAISHTSCSTNECVSVVECYLAPILLYKWVCQWSWVLSRTHFALQISVLVFLSATPHPSFSTNQCVNDLECYLAPILLYKWGCQWPWMLPSTHPARPMNMFMMKIVGSHHNRLF